jgi:hypothetical protein
MYYLRSRIRIEMKKTHIILLIFIAASIAVLISYMADLSTSETLASARKKQGKLVSVTAKLDRSYTTPIEYDPLRDPNLTSFYIIDTLGNKAKAVYYFEKPFDMEKTEQLRLKGRMQGDVFEITAKDGILMKCPSKYKDDPKAAQNILTSSN